MRQLDPGSGKTHRAYLWAYRSNALDTGPPIVVFDYQTSRSGEHARHFLEDWRGSLMVDDFGGYKALFNAGVVELACLAHARRKFFDLNQAQPNAVAQEALVRIAAFYEIERRGRELSIEERTALRSLEAAPLLDSLHAWLKATRLTVANGGGTAKAIDYSLKRWPALARYATDGALPIDNNPVENAIRPICFGEEKLALRRFGARRQACRRHSELARHRRTQRARSGRLAARYAGEAANLPQQQDRLAAAPRTPVITPSTRAGYVGRLGAYTSFTRRADSPQFPVGRKPDRAANKRVSFAAPGWFE